MRARWHTLAILLTSCAVLYSGCTLSRSPRPVASPQMPMTVTPSVESVVTADAAADALGELPSPCTALAAVHQRRISSWMPGEYLMYGAYVTELLGTNLVTQDVFSATYTSTWCSSPTPSLADVAYAFYQLYLPDSAAINSLTADFSTTPAAADSCFIGLGDITQDVWRWFVIPESGEVSLPPLDVFLADETLLAVICVLDAEPLELNWVRAGPNLNPVAEITADVTRGQVPLNVEFSLADSFDPELEPLYYEWDWNGDGVYDESGPQASCSYEFTEHGRCVVRGRANDQQGGSATAEIEIWPTRFCVEEIAEGYSPALVLDAADEPAISFSSGSEHNQLRLARPGAGNWQFTDLETLAGETEVDTAIDLAASDELALAYGGSKLHYGCFDGTLFSTELVGEDRWPGQPALALDEDDWPNILYCRAYGDFPMRVGNLTHAYSAGAWDSIRISDSGVDGRYVDAEYRGYLVAAYLHHAVSGAVGELYCGYYSTVFGWYWELIADSVARQYRSAQVEIDINHNPHLVYISEPTQVDTFLLHYVRYSGEAWSSSTITATTGECALALDSTDQAHVAYTKYTFPIEDDELWYAVYDGVGWETEYVWTIADNTLTEVDLAVDASGAPHLVFTDSPADSALTQVYYASVYE